MGFVESKVRLLATSLEREAVTEVRVWPKAIPSSSSCCRYKFYQNNYNIGLIVWCGRYLSVTLQMACGIQSGQK